MKLKLDENLPEPVQSALRALGREVEATRRVGLPFRPDPTGWQATQAAGRFLILQALDCSDADGPRPGARRV